MTGSRRRTFLKTVAGGAVSATSLGLVVASGTAVSGATKANRKLVGGLIGCGGRGLYLAGLFGKIDAVKLDWVCDPSKDRLGRATREIGVHPDHAVGDLRRLLDDSALDFVIVATPDHWHAPASILACDAHKHVYVEKPCSHNLREGRLLVEAARRNDVLVQHGTQVRSTETIREGIGLLRSGAIGDVLVARAWNIQRRRSIGHGAPGEPPAGFDYDTWVGPAPMVPYQANRVDGGWHWWFHFGTGDMGNDGVHDIDYARWGLGVETHPSTVAALGGKYFFDDDQEFPDTQQVTFEYPGSGKPGSRRMLIYEQRLWSTNQPHGVDSGVEFYGTGGQMFLSRRGNVVLLADKNREIDPRIKQQAQDAPAHVGNFIDAIRDGKKLAADIRTGHLTTTLCHLGNVATRLGRSLKFDPTSEHVVNDTEAQGLMSREYRDDHWGVPRSI